MKPRDIIRPTEFRDDLLGRVGKTLLIYGSG